MSKMMLHEGIRLGSAIRERCRHDLFRNGKSCAIGAALEAGADGSVLLASSERQWQLVRELYPVLNLLVYRSAFVMTDGSAAPPKVESLMRTIYLLNDGTDYPRERIADVVEQVEREHLRRTAAGEVFQYLGDGEHLPNEYGMPMPLPEKCITVDLSLLDKEDKPCPATEPQMASTCQ